MRCLHNHPTVRVQAGAQRVRRRSKPAIRDGPGVVRQDIDIVEEVIAKEWILDLHEPSADPVVTRSTASTCFPMGEQRFHRSIHDRPGGAVAGEPEHIQHEQGSTWIRDLSLRSSTELREVAAPAAGFVRLLEEISGGSLDALILCMTVTAQHSRGLGGVARIERCTRRKPNPPVPAPCRPDQCKSAANGFVVAPDAKLMKHPKRTKSTVGSPYVDSTIGRRPEVAAVVMSLVQDGCDVRSCLSLHFDDTWPPYNYYPSPVTGSDAAPNRVTKMA